MRNVSEKVVQKTKTHILCAIFIISKIVPLIDNVEKYSTARQVTDINMEHAHCMLAA
jgi:hypothetical protein